MSNIIPVLKLQQYKQTLINKMKQTGSESDLQQDIAELAQELTQSNFNVKQFKRMHAAKHIKLSNNRTLSRIYTEHSESKLDGGGMSLHSKTLGQGLNKTFRYNDTHIAPTKQPKFFSKPSVKSAERFQESRSKKKILPFEREGSSLERYQREWGKGKIKERCMEGWLNAILIEYCHDQYFDKAIANSALKKLGIDQNSLVAKGLPPQNVSRLYRGLFVFGMGFNSLILQLTHGNIEVLKTIWRIYSIILEYCSKGGMVTAIGEIERETSAKIAVLTSEIARKQHIIQRNQELNQLKNGEIFREIKKLREDNVNLNNEKIVLVEEYSSTEQAFSEEVGLRLKFQTKINEIYGLHRELGIKHQRLFQELSQKVQQLRTCADKYFQSTIKTQQFKQTQYKLREELILLRLSSKKQAQYLEQLVRERIQLLSQLSKIQYISVQLQNEVSELRNREKRWINDKINMEATIQFRQKSSKETHQEYQITLEENNRLYILLSDQRKIMEEYEKEKKNFNSKVISIVSENSYHRRKMEEAQRKLDALQETHRELVLKIQQLTLELEIKTKSEESFQSFFSNSDLNFVQMRKINIAHQEQLLFLRKYHANMERVLTQKNQNLQVLTHKHNKNINETERLTVQMQELRSKYVILSQQKHIADQTYVLKQAKLKVMEQELDIKRQQLEKIKLSYSLEEQRLRSSLDQTLINYKNQKFERATLNSSYMQTLKIVEKKNAAQRELNVKISLLQGDVEKEKTRYHLLEKNMRETVNKMAKAQSELQGTMELQRVILLKKQEYRHPIYVQDLTAALQREIQHNTAKTARIKFLEIELQKSKQFCQQQIQRLGQKYRWDMNVVSKQAQNKIEVLISQLTFQKKNSSQLKAQLRQYEILAESYRKKISERETSEREEIYKRAIEQRKKQAEAMLLEMVKLQDQLQQSHRKNAELSLRQSAPRQSGEQSHRGSTQAIRKQLEHEYDFKFRELQREMKQQISQKQQEFKEEQQSIIRGMSVQQFLKVKDMKPSELMKELSNTLKTDKFRELSAQHSVDINRQTFYKKGMARNHEELNNRRQINRFIKQAYDYYN